MNHPRENFVSEDAWRKKILDPQGPFLQKWNKIVVLSCLMAVSLDPMFFYVPVIDDGKKCLSVDRTMEITASVLRSFTDIFYMLHIIFQFRTGFIAPSSRESGRGVLVEDTRAIAKRYLSSYFVIDILSVLPLPQVVILIITPKMAGSSYLNTKNMLKFVVIFQYVPRFIRIYPLYREVATSRILRETAWAGAAFNLFLFMLASHVIGAFWYLFSIERQTNCWRQACGIQDTCKREYLFCDGAGGAGNLSFLDNHCPVTTPNETVFNFGIFLDALQSGVVLSSTGFSDKFFYCFWWGLRNLSSLGQNLKTSTYVWEICFADFISISGLVLLSFIARNFQTNLQSTTTRFQTRDEEMPVQNPPRDLSVSSNTSSPSETEIMDEANHDGEDQGNNDHAIIINGGEGQGNNNQYQAVFISISGVATIAFLIGNMQTYLQSTTTRFQRRDEEMPVQNLPRDLSVSSNTSSPSETEIMEEANHAGEDQGNNDHAITISGGEDQGNIDHANHNQ